MKLINYTLLYLSLALLFIIGAWAGIFYVNMLDEIYDSIDDGLDNYKTLIIQKAKTDSTLLYKKQFDESNYAIRPVPANVALNFKDSYADTLMYMANEDDNEPVRLLTTTFVLDKEYYELKVISSMVEEDDLMEDLFYSVCWLYVMLIVSVLLVNNVVLKKAWKPFYQLIEQVQQFRLGKENKVVLQKTKVAEFQLLNDTVDGLLKRNQETFTSQKQFIENAAHELQTPLAISINKLELLAEKMETQEENMQSIAGVMQTLERLTRLNKSLLLISKIENKQFVSKEKVDFNQVFIRLIEEYEDLASFKEVKLYCNELESCVVNINKDLADVLAGNLLKNAIVHNKSGGLVLVQLMHNEFTIENTGLDKKLDEVNLFKRFYKESSEKNSTGLGLSIVKAILDLYKGHVSYTFSDRHKVTVRFDNFIS